MCCSQKVAGSIPGSSSSSSSSSSNSSCRESNLRRFNDESSVVPMSYPLNTYINASGNGKRHLCNTICFWILTVLDNKKPENYLLQGHLSVMTLISVFIRPHQHVKDSGHSAKSAGSRLQLKAALYVCGFE